MQNLKNKILSYNTKLSEADLDFTIQCYKKQDIEKGDFVIHPGQYVKHWYYVEQGCFYYYIIKDGVEKVMEFFTENDFFTDLYAYIQDKPSNSYIKATENSTIYAITKNDVQAGYDRSHQLERFGRLSMQDTVVNTFRRTVHLNNLSNEERYLRLLQKRPTLFQRVPQYLIASYLGLTPVGLSKIRKRLSLS